MAGQLLHQSCLNLWRHLTSSPSDAAVRESGAEQRHLSLHQVLYTYLLRVLCQSCGHRRLRASQVVSEKSLNEFFLPLEATHVLDEKLVLQKSQKLLIPTNDLNRPETRDRLTDHLVHVAVCDASDAVKTGWQHILVKKVDKSRTHFRRNTV